MPCVIITYVISRIVIYSVLAYLIGSIPWGLVIGEFLFKKDIRQYGSGNLGGTNAARVLGLPIGILVIFLDAFKALLMMYAVNKINPGIEQYVGLAVCIGHCFPIFAGFKGGKAVACAYGYLLGLAMFVNHEYLYTFICPLASFFIILLLGRMVSLSSMLSVTLAGILISIFVDLPTGSLVLLLAVFIIYRHLANIKRIIEGTESKIFLKK